MSSPLVSGGGGSKCDYEDDRSKTSQVSLGVRTFFVRAVAGVIITILTAVILSMIYSSSEKNRQVLCEE